MLGLACALKFPHCGPGESDGRWLPGDAKAGAVGGSEAGGGWAGWVTAAGRDGHWSRGLRAEGEGQNGSISTQTEQYIRNSISMSSLKHFHSQALTSQSCCAFSCIFICIFSAFSAAPSAFGLSLFLLMKTVFQTKCIIFFYCWRGWKEDLGALCNSI